MNPLFLSLAVAVENLVQNTTSDLLLVVAVAVFLLFSFFGQAWLFDSKFHHNLGADVGSVVLRGPCAT